MLHQHDVFRLRHEYFVAVVDGASLF